MLSTMMRGCASRGAMSAALARRLASTSHATSSAASNKPISQSAMAVNALPNGLRVTCDENKSELSTVSIHVEAGTRHENAANNGVTNFIARLAAKGTPSRNKSSLEVELAKMGATLNVTPGREITTFSINGFSKDSAKHVDILSDIVQNAIYDENYLHQERDNTMEFVKAQQSNYTAVVMDYLYSVAYQGTPLAHSLQGTTKNINNIDRKTIQSFIDNNYKAPRMLLTSVGNTSLDKLSELAHKHLSGVSNEYPDGHAEIVKPCRFTGAEVQHRDDDLSVGHVAFAVPACDVNNPDKYPLMMANALAGCHDSSHGGGYGAMRSWFGGLVHEKANMLYSAHGFLDTYSDGGIIGIYTVADPENLDDAGIYAGRFWMNMAKYLVDSTYNRAKGLLKNQIIFESLNPTKSSHRMAQEVFFQDGERYSLDELLSCVDAVDLKRMNQVCFKYFHDKEFARAAYGATEGVRDYNRMRDTISWSY